MEVGMEAIPRHDDCPGRAGEPLDDRVEALMPLHGTLVLVVEYSVRCLTCGVELYVVEGK